MKIMRNINLRFVGVTEQWLCLDAFRNVALERNGVMREM